MSNAQLNKMKMVRRSPKSTKLVPVAPKKNTSEDGKYIMHHAALSIPKGYAQIV